MKSKILFMFLLLMPLLLGGWPERVGAEETLQESKLKVAFMVNFAKFITWPQATSTNAPFQLAILGNDLPRAAMQGLEDKTINGRKIQWRFLAAASEDLLRDQVVLVGRSQQRHMEVVVKACAGKPVVTVSDIEGFAEAGGIFEFRIRDGRLGFIINNSKARENGLQISASLLNLALEIL